MGVEREDTDPSPAKGGTEPGLGPKRANGAASAGAPTADEPAPVDFDALHAALGDLPQPGSMPSKPPVSDSEGRSSATYASARPHTIPPTHQPSDLDAPPVIVAAEDTATVPSAPPKMTMPLSAAIAQAKIGSGPASDPHPPTSGNQAVAKPQPSYPFTPQPFPVQRGVAQPTMKMPERPRRPKSPTVVVRPRGPSKTQKLFVFASMLMLFLAFATAVAIWRQPGWFGLEAAPPPPPPPATHTAPPAISTPSLVVAPPQTNSAITPSASTRDATSGSAGPSTSVKPPLKKPPFQK
jgi:hypothetical protein